MGSRPVKATEEPDQGKHQKEMVKENNESLDPEARVGGGSHNQS